MSGHGKGYEGRERYQRKFTFTNQPQKEGQEKEKKKLVSEWLYYIGSAKQSSDCKKLTEHLINLIKQDFKYGNDITFATIKQDLIDKSI